MSFNKLLYVWIFFCVSSMQGKELNIYELSFAELAQLDVIPASREPTPIDFSPSVVSVITEEEIQKRGYRNLF